MILVKSLGHLIPPAPYQEIVGKIEGYRFNRFRMDRTELIEIHWTTEFLQRTQTKLLLKPNQAEIFLLNLFVTELPNKLKLIFFNCLIQIISLF